MKAALILVFSFLVFAASAQSGAQAIIKQRAKDLRDQNNARQGVPPAARPATPAAAPAAAPATAPVTLTAQQQALLRLNASLSAIKPGTPVSDSLKQNLTRDLLGAARGVKPSTTATAKLSESLAEALSAKLLSRATANRLLKNLDAVLNPGSLPASHLKDVTDDMKSLFTASGVPGTVAAQIALHAEEVGKTAGAKK